MTLSPPGRSKEADKPPNPYISSVQTQYANICEVKGPRKPGMLSLAPQSTGVLPGLCPLDAYSGWPSTETWRHLEYQGRNLGPGELSWNVGQFAGASSSPAMLLTLWFLWI